MGKNTREERLVKVKLILVLTIVFIVTCTATAFAVNNLMVDVKIKETGYTNLKVEPNYGNQTDNHYNLQPARNVQVQ